MFLHDRETREARATVENGRKLKICETSSGGRRVRKSRARIGVRTECNERNTGKGECRKRVNRKWLCRGGGRLLKWASREGSVKRVVRERSGWKGAWGMGDEVPLGGAEGQAASGGGDPWGDGKGDGGAAAFTVESGGSTVPLAFFRGGGTLEAVLDWTSMPSIKSSELCARFFPYRSTASASPTTILSCCPSSGLIIRHPTPDTTSCSSCMSSSPISPSRNVARAPFGNTRGNFRNECGRLACKSG